MLFSLFKEERYRLDLSCNEYNLIIKCLIDLRNKLIAQGKYTDAVDDILMNMIK